MMSKRPLSTDSIGNVTAENRKRGRIASDDLETSRAKISQQRANSEYTVGWICAITTESVAARAFLDEEYSGLEAVAQHDNNSYILGKIGCHNVVIAVLPDAEYGTTSAAAVARDMLHSFPNVRIGLMVGIGGGAPSLKHDIRLGDVVVSSPGGGKGGVFQYDFGKTIQNQTFQETAFLDQPPTVLRTAVSTLKGIHDMKGHQLVDDVEMALKKIKKRKKYRKPPPASDRLYRSGVIHPSHSPESCEIACGNDEANLLVRDKREEEDDDPAIHYGLIASGNQLMKDAHIRDKLADENGILCFEMEAAGLMNHFPCLVIRGICDYSDSHKNKDWQEYAAMMAAAYAKDLLRQIPSNKVERERRIGEVVDLLQEGLRCLCQTANETKAEVETMRRNHHLAGVERWLCPPDTSTNFNEARKKWHEGSGLWFLDSPAFNEWKCGSHYLWLHGLAGCGKTILSATIVDHLQKMDDCIVLQFYFDFNNTTKQKVDGVLRSLVFQLGSSSKELGSLYQSHFGCQSQPDNPSLTKTLHTMMKNSKTTYLVMDALDECTEREELLQWMMEFFKAPDLGHVRLIATSRPEEVFLRRIPSWIGKKHCLKLDKEAINADIRSYVTTKLEQSPDFLEKELSHNLLKRIRNKVGDRADGMFRWAACQLASLAKCMSPRDIETALETLPWDLNETYQRMLQNIPANLKKDAIRLLQFLVHGKRPLTLREAVEIIATQTDEEPRSFDLKRRLFRDNDILQYCPNLVSVINIVDYKGARKELHLAHFSVKEYLLKEGQFDLSLASIAITRTCLTYLTDIEGRLWEIKERFPMARYAAEYWMDYAALAERSEDVVQTSTKFLQDESTFQRWDQLYRARNELTSVPASKQESRLYYACLGGLVAVSRALIDGGADVNVQGGHYGTALQAAANGGHRDITQLLLDRGADINAKGGIYGTALLAASQGGYRDIVQLLLDRGADANAQDGDCNNALLAASQGGYRDIVQLLLDRGADVNAQGGDYDNGLQAASHGGYQDIVQLLLDRGADANAKGSHYGTALLVASEGGHQDIVQLLLDRGADVSAQGGDYDNALQAASQGGHRDIVQLLLDRGADVNAQGGDYDNALQAASHGGYQDIVQLLLDRGADANAQGSHYGTALLVALNSGHRNIFQLLLDRGADIRASNKNGRTPFILASGRGCRATELSATAATANRKGVTVLSATGLSTD
ncbi:hypothetical protein QBC36DRAFT_331536 [Triangularia setosa]|uniref:NACHT domain-containing protein n=1 Tax=Triangularia setosa TaxID=2587417 RepID=A0AAN6W4S4_9PEZI|nr:hypothetical protein QBC36DRAFT_331536 [Podospora setosa]